MREQGHEIDAFGNALLTIESALPAEVDEADADPSGSLVVLSGVSMMYFGIPVNERLLEFWDIVEDRLFKIRHSLDIRGKARSRYPDGIGLEASSALAAAGTIADTAAGALATVPLPAYRFQVMVQKANEFAGDVRALGAAVLSAMEKRDGEALARLRASHEIALLQAALRVRGLQIEEAQHALEAAMRGREGAEIRHRYYTSREFISATEAVKEALFIVASGLQVASGGLELTAAVMHALPDVTVGAGGHGNSPHGSVSYGASQLGNAVSATARALSLMSSVAQIGSTMAGTLATYERRKEEWDHQAKLAENDMEQFDQQTTRFPEALPKPPDPQAAPAPRAASRMFSARRDFADAWYRFLNPRDNQPDLLLDFDLSPARFPYPVAGAATMLKTLKVVLLTESAAGANLKARLAWVGVDGNATPIPGHPVPEPPAGTPPAPVRFSGDAALAGLRSATFGVPSAANTGIWRLQISRSDNAGSAGGLLQPGATPDVIRIDRAQIHDIVVICSYDPA